MKTLEEKYQDLDDLFEFILKVQSKVADQVATQSEMDIGEGRKGVILIRGGHKWVKIFEVQGGRIVPKEDLSNTRTVVAFKDVDVFIELCNSLLLGQPSAFSRARARGDIVIEGDHAIRDLSVLTRLLAKVGQVLNNYNVKAIG